MCLYVNVSKTEQELKNPEPRVFFKIFVKAKDCPFTPYAKDCLFTPYWKYSIYQPGTVIVPHPVLFEGQPMINENAFHARTTEKALKQDSFYCEYFDRGKPLNVTINANHEDIIAFGIQDDVALKAYTITKETWNLIFLLG
jgi:hypothetical protein